MQKCTICLIEKEFNLNNFYARENGNLRRDCKECRLEEVKNNYINNRNKLIEYQKKYRKNEENNKKIKKRNKEYYINNKDILNEKNRIRKLKNPNYAKENYRKNAEKRKEYSKIYRLKPEVKNRRKEKRKIENLNPIVKLKNNVSRSIRKGLKKCLSSKNNNTCSKYLNFSFFDLKYHLEQLWEPWMNWDNYGVYRLGEDKKWNIDHIIPQSALPYSSMEEENFKKCWSLENLRPIEATKNFSKNNKFIDNLIHFPILKEEIQ